MKGEQSIFRILTGVISLLAAFVQVSMAQEGTLLWQYQALTGYGPAPVNSGPAVGRAYRVFFSNAGFIYAVNHGLQELIWKNMTVDGGGTYAVGFYEEVCGGDALGFSCWQGDFVGVGEMKWGTSRWQSGEIIRSGGDKAPAISLDGTIYAVGQHYPGEGDPNIPYPTKLFALDPSGAIKWTFDLDCNSADVLWKDENPLSPVVGPDGTIYVGVNQCTWSEWPKAYLYALDPTGQQKWSYECAEVLAPPAVDHQGNVYFPQDVVKPMIPPGRTEPVPAHSNSLIVLNPQGVELWKFPLVIDTCTSPVIGVDGTVYICVNDSYQSESSLHAIGPNGAAKWTFPAGDEIHSTPAIGADGVIYFGSDDKKLYAVNPDGSERWSYKTKGAVRSSPMILKDGTIYVGSQDTFLYAIRSSSKGLAQSPWPADRGNVYRTATCECLKPTFVGDEIFIEVPCAKYGDLRFAFTFRLRPSNGNILFDLDFSTFTASQGGPCVTVNDGDLSIPVFCAEILGRKYKFLLSWREGLTWELILASFAEWGGY
jgi:outer membrane protein assembly factor BamB